jgi:hypothetical protein
MRVRVLAEGIGAMDCNRWLTELKRGDTVYIHCPYSAGLLLPVVVSRVTKVMVFTKNTLEDRHEDRWCKYSGRALQSRYQHNYLVQSSGK